MVVAESWFTRMPSFPWRISWCCCSNHIIITRGAFIQFNRPRLPTGGGARFSGGAGGLRRPAGRHRWRFLPPCCQARSRFTGAAVWWLMTGGWGRRGASASGQELAEPGSAGCWTRPTRLALRTRLRRNEVYKLPEWRWADQMQGGQDCVVSQICRVDGNRRKVPLNCVKICSGI